MIFSFADDLSRACEVYGASSPEAQAAAQAYRSRCATFSGAAGPVVARMIAEADTALDVATREIEGPA